MNCRHCGGPIQRLRRGLDVWRHDNAGGYYGGTEMTHEAEPVRTTAERLLVRLRAEGFDLPKGTKLVRLYPGHHQRSAGAWSWAGEGDVYAMNLGSVYTMKQILRAKKISWLNTHGHIELFPEDREGEGGGGGGGGGT